MNCSSLEDRGSKALWHKYLEVLNCAKRSAAPADMLCRDVSGFCLPLLMNIRMQTNLRHISKQMITHLIAVSVTYLP